MPTKMPKNDPYKPNPSPRLPVEEKNASLPEEDVERYLLENPAFLERWIEKHGTPEFMNNAVKENVLNTAPSFSGSSNQDSITSRMFAKYVEGKAHAKKKPLIHRDKLLAMNESEMFMELIKDIASELDVNVLCHKILRNVSILTGSDRGSLFLVRMSKDKRVLVSKLFDVTQTSTLEDSLHTEETEIVVPFGRGIAGTVAETKQFINIQDAYKDPRFNKEIDKKTGFRTHSILCMPIFHDSEVIGVAQIINKITGAHVFDDHDVQLFRKYLMFCGIGISNAQLFEMSLQEYTRNKLLLNLARGVFEEQQNMEKLIQKIMSDAMSILQCERCSVYLIEDPLDTGDVKKSDSDKPVRKAISQCKNKDEIHFSTAFDLYANDSENIHTQSATELMESKNTEIAQFVALQQNYISIADLVKDGRFGSGPFTGKDGYTTRSVLCMPVFNTDNTITAVTMLINKHSSSAFNNNDATIIEAFSIFTGLGIRNCQMYENACRLMAKQAVALEVLSFHATAGSDETEKLVKSEMQSEQEEKLYRYDFNDLVISDFETLKCTICMFKEAGLLTKYKIPLEVICRWTCSVKKNYRPVTYHNWRHAFNVTQTMFTMLYTGDMAGVFDSLDILAMLVACLCHDLDHRGTNNAFQVKVVSPLAMLYSTSVMEHHHFDHSIMIINSEGNNIFQSLESNEYRRVIKMLEFCILSTDLALYFKKRGNFQNMVAEGRKDFQTSEDKNLLKAMMMTACDVAAITKPWEIQREIAQLVAGEFFEQGDVEKVQLGETVAMFDRDKKDELPKMQVGFIDAICMPVYEALAALFPGCRPLLLGAKDNRGRWHELDLLYQQGDLDEFHRRMKIEVTGITYGETNPTKGVLCPCFPWC